MKLRIRGNSLRFRVTRSELARLVETGRLEEAVNVAFDESSRLIYALEHEQASEVAVLRYQQAEIAIVLSTQELENWAKSDRVGLYAEIDLGSRGTLELLLEKDFGCLDSTDAEF